MPDLTQILDVLVHHPEQWASASMLFLLAAGLVKWTPPRADEGRCPDCKGGPETCTCGPKRVHLPRRITGGAR